jgi:hypothetical protein
MKYTIVHNIAKYANELDRLGLYSQASQLDQVARSLVSEAEISGSDLDTLVPATKINPVIKDVLREGIRAVKDPESAAIRFARALRPKDLEKKLDNLKMKLQNNPGYSVALENVRNMLSRVSALGTKEELKAAVNQILNRLYVIERATDVSKYEKDAVSSMIYDIKYALNTSDDSFEFKRNVEDAHPWDDSKSKLPSTSRYPLIDE